MWRVIYSVSPRTPKEGQAGKSDKPHPSHILRSRGAHTQLLLATSEREKVVTEKGRNDEGGMTKVM
ncbi:phosphinothricin acetyltransferase [Capnocytophaga sp. oral taxon 864]|uniref:phosphinothricin acetyltransferase n=1 Tax=Capnocytophaga sp. oral taxon 864 TaxID=1316593 RepID=UPI000D02B48A|nr:phosphinothricin acetyltransferase [Capnocytophaga sp. oral taxon 864]